jgi:hypothetical protein
MRLRNVIISAAILAGSCMSCTITTHTVGDNPVGSKIGRKNAWIGNTMDLSYKTAASEGSIKKIGTSEHRIMTVLGYTRYTTIVTGE